MATLVASDGNVPMGSGPSLRFFVASEIDAGDMGNLRALAVNGPVVRGGGVRVPGCVAIVAADVLEVLLGSKVVADTSNVSSRPLGVFSPTNSAIVLEDASEMRELHVNEEPSDMPGWCAPGTGLGLAVEHNAPDVVPGFSGDTAVGVAWARSAIVSAPLGGITKSRSFAAAGGRTTTLMPLVSRKAGAGDPTGLLLVGHDID